MGKGDDLQPLAVVVVVPAGYDPERTLSEAEAARLLGRQRNELAMIRHKGHGPAHTIKGKRTPVYRLADVVQFAQERARISLRPIKGE